jgi:hypothetical protein
MRRIARGSRIYRSIGRVRAGGRRLRQQVVWRIEKAPAIPGGLPDSKSLDFEKAPSAPGATDLHWQRSGRIQIAVLFEGTNKSLPSGYKAAGAGERLLLDSDRTAARGQTEFPYGCGWRFAHRKRISGRAAVVAVLKSRR